MESKVNELEIKASCLISYSDVVIVKSEDPEVEDDAKELNGFHVAEFAGGEYTGKQEHLLEFDPITREKLRHEFWPRLQKIIEQAKASGVLPKDFNCNG